MNCVPWRERIALHVEGDLPARQADFVEAHLAACASCREFAIELRDSQAVLKELAAEPVDGVMLDGVRARVMARVAGRRPPAAYPWRWMWVPACAAALALVVLWPRELPDIPPPPVPLAGIPDAPAPPVIRWPRPPVVRHAAAAPQPVPPLLMRIVTDDPNVVIYWIVEGKEKGD